MTGTIGFIIGAICIGLFAFTMEHAYVTVPRAKLRLFSMAFGLFATAMVLWALAVILNATVSTRELLLASDCLLLLATGCMFKILFDPLPNWLLALLAAVGAMLISLRAYEYRPTGFVHDGLLYFNLSTGVRTVFTLAFAGLWLPAVIVITGYLAQDKYIAGLRNILTVSFASLVAVAALFMAARRSTVIISLFAMIAGLFLAMAAANIVMIKIHKTAGGKHAARSKR